MEVLYDTKKLKKIFDSEKNLRREYGDERAKKIIERLDIFENAQSLFEVSEFPPPRRHELSGNRKGQFSVVLNANYRLIFVPANEPVPLKSDGGFNLEKITTIKIIEVIDYHGE